MVAHSHKPYLAPDQEKQARVVIVIPIYNERETLEPLMKRLVETIDRIDLSVYNCQVLFVDDQSPDGSGEVIEEFTGIYPFVHLLVNKEKKGIGWAYTVGFKYAMTVLKADFIIEMDGDLQHPPELILDLLMQIHLGADMVLGSRHIKGGENPISRGLGRYLLTAVGGILSRLILFFPTNNFWKITDPTTGFRITRVHGFFDQIDFDNLISYDFAYKYDTLLQVANLGADVREVPLRFDLRKSGESKMGKGAAKQALKSALWLRANRK